MRGQEGQVEGQGTTHTLGVTKRKRIQAAKAHEPDDSALQKMPRAATLLASIVSSAMCPAASHPIMFPVAYIMTKSQFQPEGIPVPLFCVRNASEADRKPYVLEAAMGIQMRLITGSRMR